MSLRVALAVLRSGSGERGRVRPERVRRAETRVVGIQAQTSTRREADPATAAVPALWRRFQDDGLADAIPDRAGTRTTCAVYSDYQDGGASRCLVGAEVTGAGEVPAGMVAVTVPAGDYLVFAARGPMPEALAATWARVAEFFDHAGLARAQRADLEVHYAAGSAVDVRGRRRLSRGLGAQGRARRLGDVLEPDLGVGDQTALLVADLHLPELGGAAPGQRGRLGLQLVCADRPQEVGGLETPTTLPRSPNHSASPTLAAVSARVAWTPPWTRPKGWCRSGVTGQDSTTRSPDASSTRTPRSLTSPTSSWSRPAGRRSRSSSGCSWPRRASARSRWITVTAGRVKIWMS